MTQTSKHNLFDTFQEFDLGDGKKGEFYSLPQLEKAGIGPISKLPVSIRIVLESVLRNYDGKGITEENVRALANWKPNAPRDEEVPFTVSRIILQDFTGVPLLVDLAAMRDAAVNIGKDPKIVEPQVPVDLVVDHSVQVDYFGSPKSLKLNMEVEFKRNHERYEFLKWGRQAFNGLSVVPPGIGIVHQVNLEYLARGVLNQGNLYFPDTLVGTDSHTPMINGLGVVGWGVGGIEAEAGILGEPIHILTPDVVGVHMTGKLNPGVTATDLVLHITNLLRKHNVVGKFVEYHGEGAASLSLPDRATIGNMSPEYGATIGYFPVDEETCRYMLATGRTEEQVNNFCKYFQAQGLFGMPKEGEIEYSELVELDLSTVTPSVAGPKRPQDRIGLEELRVKFADLMARPITDNGFGKSAEEMKKVYLTAPINNGKESISGGGSQDGGSLPFPTESEAFTTTEDTNSLTEREMADNRNTPDEIELAQAKEEITLKEQHEIRHGDVVVAAITSCTNTSNPNVMLAAGLLARNAIEKGMKIKPTVKTSLAPGSRVVTQYLEKTDLQKYFDQLGFNTVGYGCTTCIGNSGPLEEHIEKSILDNDLVVCSVLSGNRNFEARIHQNIKANFLMSPPLVVAFALAGTVNIDIDKDPIGKDKDGNDVYLKEIWPSTEEILELVETAYDRKTFQEMYADVADQSPLWNEIEGADGDVYEWSDSSTYIQNPPFFDGYSLEGREIKDIVGARTLGIFGESLTTDHISPAGAIKPSSPAGRYLQEKGVGIRDFNSYGSRRGNDRVMTRGTFANVRIKNLMVPGVEGGVTVHQPSGEQLDIYDAAMRYKEEKVPLIVLAGTEYGTGSSRDWAAKGTILLGVEAVIAKSFERIHRSNLVGMGVLPLQFKDSDSVDSLGLDGTETFDIKDIQNLAPRQEISMTVHRTNGETIEVPLVVRIDTPIEIEYYKAGGILQYVLTQLATAK